MSLVTRQRLFCKILNLSSFQEKALICKEVKQKIHIAFKPRLCTESFSHPLIVGLQIAKGHRSKILFHILHKTNLNRF